MYNNMYIYVYHWLDFTDDDDCLGKYSWFHAYFLYCYCQSYYHIASYVAI